MKLKRLLVLLLICAGVGLAGGVVSEPVSVSPEVVQVSATDMKTTHSRVIASVLSFALCVGMCASPLAGIIAAGRQTGGGGATYLLKQNFEGTGYDNGETWTTSVGTPDPDYTTVVLEGLQSLYIPFGNRIRADFTNQTEVWAYAMVRYVGASAPGGDRKLMTFGANGSGTEQASVVLTSAMALKVVCGTSITTVGTLTLGTTYHVWFHYTKGSGADAVCDVGFSTDGTRPTSGNNFRQLTNGTFTTNAGRIWLGHTPATGPDLVMDKVRVDDAQIGDNPS